MERKRVLSPHFKPVAGGCVHTPQKGGKKEAKGGGTQTPAGLSSLDPKGSVWGYDT